MRADYPEARTMQDNSSPFKLAIIGFGAVGQGVARVVQSVPHLEVVAIADSKGVALTPDLEDVLARKRMGKSIANSDLTALDVIRTVDHDVVVEVTPTNIENGEPGLTHLREALKNLSLIHISEPTRLGMISYAVFCLKKKKNTKNKKHQNLNQHIKTKNKNKISYT